MNEPTIQLDVRPEVEEFVAEVRRHLADLPADDRDDLTEGLAADLSDLVSERGSGVLGDPGVEAVLERVVVVAGQSTSPSRYLSASSLATDAGTIELMSPP